MVLYVQTHMVWKRICIFFFVPFFASMFAYSFPSMLVWALTLYIVVHCERFLSISTMDVSMVLS